MRSLSKPTADEKLIFLMALELTEGRANRPRSKEEEGPALKTFSEEDPLLPLVVGKESNVGSFSDRDSRSTRFVPSEVRSTTEGVISCRD